MIKSSAIDKKRLKRKGGTKDKLLREKRRWNALPNFAEKLAQALRGPVGNGKTVKHEVSERKFLQWNRGKNNKAGSHTT